MIRIVSDGTAWGTKVFDSEGKRIERIVSVEILPISCGEIVQARITFADVQLDVIGEDGRLERTDGVTGD